MAHKPDSLLERIKYKIEDNTNENIIPDNNELAKEFLPTIYKKEWEFVSTIESFSYLKKTITIKFEVSKDQTHLKIPSGRAAGIQLFNCANEGFGLFMYKLAKRYIHQFHIAFTHKEFITLIETNGLLDGRQNTGYYQTPKDEPFEQVMKLEYLAIKGGLFNIIMAFDGKKDINGKKRGMYGYIEYSTPLENNPNKDFLKLLDKKFHVENVSPIKIFCGRPNILSETNITI